MIVWYLIIASNLLDILIVFIMVLENTDVTDTICNYLDLRIICMMATSLNKSYDKREDYVFDVIRYPNLSGNIPCGPAYGVFILV